MIDLVLSNSHLLCAQWSRASGESIITDLNYFPLSHSLKEILYHDTELNSVLNVVFRQLTSEVAIDGHDVRVTIDQSLVHQEIITLDEDLSIEDGWDYILWKQSLFWGDKIGRYALYGEMSVPGPNQINVLACPRELRNLLKLTISELGASPVWMGTFLTTLVSGEPFLPRAYVFDHGRFYSITLRNDTGLWHGRVKFTAKGPEIMVQEGFELTVEELFGLKENDRYSFVTPDALSENKIAQWESFGLRIMEPFAGINTEIVISDESIPVRELNVLTALITGQAPDNSANLFDAPGIHEVVLKPKNVRTDSPDQVEEREPPDETTEELPAKKKENRIQALVFVLIIIIIGAAFYLKSPAVIPEGEPSVQDEHASTSVVAVIEAPTVLTRLKGQSSSYLLTLNILLEELDWRHLLRARFQGERLELDLATADTMALDDLLDGNLIYHTEEELACCGGKQQTYQFQLNPISIPTMESWIQIHEIDSTLRSLVPDAVIRRFDPVTRAQFIYDPLVIKVTTVDRIRNMLSYLNSYSENVVTRKIILSNDPEAPLLESLFYLSVIRSTSE